MGAVESITKEYKGIADFLAEQKQPSLQSDVNKYFTKILVLSAASYFEHQIQEILIEFVSTTSNKDLRVTNFLKKKAIGQQYHTFFDWGKKNNPEKPGKNANSFFALFGEEFKKELNEEIKNNEELDLSIKAFLEIGHLRNLLVHSNFAAYSLDFKTSDEIFTLYNKATAFISFIENKLK